MSHHQKVAVVTGATSGIGKSVAEHFAQDGIAVVLSDVNQTLGEQAAAQIRQAGGQANFVMADASRPSDCEHVVDVALAQYGRLDYACIMPASAVNKTKPPIYRSKVGSTF